MKNFPIIDKETGREYWISRSVAVLGPQWPQKWDVTYSYDT